MKRSLKKMAGFWGGAIVESVSIRVVYTGKRAAGFIWGNAFHALHHFSRVGSEQGDPTRPDPTRPVRLEQVVILPKLAHDNTITS